MYFQYETERLKLELLGRDRCSEVLQFYQKNRKLFESYEGLKPNNFYTPGYQSEILKMEYQMALKGQGVRFFVRLKENGRIIGTTSLQNLQGPPYQSGILGYRFDGDYHHQGYAFEAVSKLLMIGFQELNLKRVVAYVQRLNQSSLRLLQRLNFSYEGTARCFANIQGEWTDHDQYSLIKD